MAFHILDPEYDRDLRNNSILGLGTYSEFSVVDLSDLYIHIGSPFLLMLHIKFGFDWPSGFRGEDV